jgi:hypothetical protein
MVAVRFDFIALSSLAFSKQAEGQEGSPDVKISSSSEEDVFDERSDCENEQNQDDYAAQAHAPHHAAAVHHLLHLISPRQLF